MSSEVQKEVVPLSTIHDCVRRTREQVRQSRTVLARSRSLIDRSRYLLIAAQRRIEAFVDDTGDDRVLVHFTACRLVHAAADSWADIAVGSN
jgi:uncharacterized protein (DUF1499 family)